MQLSARRERIAIVCTALNLRNDFQSDLPLDFIEQALPSDSGKELSNDTHNFLLLAVRKANSTVRLASANRQRWKKNALRESAVIIANPADLSI